MNNKEIKTMVVSLPKDYDFNTKLEAIKSGGFAWHKTTIRNATPNYKEFCVLHNGTRYYFDAYLNQDRFFVTMAKFTKLDLDHSKHDYIPYDTLLRTEHTGEKGFQGYRYE